MVILAERYSGRYSLPGSIVSNDKGQWRLEFDDLPGPSMIKRAYAKRSYGQRSRSVGRIGGIPQYVQLFDRCCCANGVSIHKL